MNCVFGLDPVNACFRVEADPETSTSSFLEESDGSSAQRSPSYSSEPEHAALCAEPGHVTSGIGHVTVGLSHVRRVGTATGRSAPPPVTPHLEMRVPQFNISAPSTPECDPAWYSTDDRNTPSPAPGVSPRVSPSPKALKSATDLRIRITPAAGDTPPFTGEEARTPARISLRSSRSKPVSRDSTPSRGQHLESSSIPHVCTTSVNQLTVPSARRGHREGSESSSSSSYYPSSSRSATNSPKTPDSPDSPWAIDPARISSLYFKKQPVVVGPTQTPITRSLTSVAAEHRLPLDTETRTSSTQRPLGVKQIDSSHVTPNPGHTRAHAGHHPMDDAPKWHSERWKHWEKLAKQNSEEFHEQETLV